jgi:hypothetical protein
MFRPYIILNDENYKDNQTQINIRYNKFKKLNFNFAICILSN